MPIVVRDDDVRGVQLAVSKPASVTGQLVTQAAASRRPARWSSSTVLLTPLEHDALSQRGSGHVVRPDADGRFTFPEGTPHL